ncbi:unnamed protein product [Dicrocoelium dendriticum]|nr:unnamed protein product [Dicrocoelium dendriticum]
MGSLTNQLILRLLLSYTGWMYRNRGKRNIFISLWTMLLSLAKSKHPRLYGYQYSLPSLPLPRLQDTMNRYLLSVRHLLPVKEYEEIAREADAFCKGPGRKLQFFLHLKTWFTSNYVTDWWEDYVYLANRDPLMSNSNFYGLEWKLTRPIQPTQEARAAMLTYLLLEVRRKLAREEMAPLLINQLVPLCSWQYERPFNTTRVPYLKKDKLVHLPDSSHIVAYYRGRYYRCPFVVDGRRLSPAELEYMFNHLLSSDQSSPAGGEEMLAALTAGPRDSWAIARATFFSTGLNRASLSAIERAAFFLAFDDEQRELDFDNSADLSYLGKTFLTGNCYNRWFDKSFTLAVLPDGTFGFNIEHSWADAPICSHIVELVTAYEHIGIEKCTPGLHYVKGGSCDGTVNNRVLPSRLRWDISPQCSEVIKSSYRVARTLADSIDLVVVRFRDFGRGFMKKMGFSPDAFVQMALQLAYFMDMGSMALVYESSMTRLFREGRTETVRSCTAEATEFVRAMLDNGATLEYRARQFRIATDRHQRLTKDAMSGKGVDRHLFALYIMSKFLRLESPFLKKILSEPWRLSTSQTPTNQTAEFNIPPDHPDAHRCSGGGFGPVDKNGYGVSYIFSSEIALSFHVSSSFDCAKTAE